MTIPAHRIVYLPGVAWTAVAGTDRRLAEAIGRSGRVLWVDPAASVIRWRGPGWPVRWSWLDDVSEGVSRLRTSSPPAVTRWGVRSVAAAVQKAALASRLDFDPSAVVLADPCRTFPDLPERVVRMYYVTDDWVAGAHLMGLSRRHVARLQAANVDRAHVVAAVSPHLAESLGRRYDRSNVAVLPNGCNPPGWLAPQFQPAVGVNLASDSPRAALVGQLNERLDLSLLNAVTDAGVRVLVVGPRSDQQPQFSNDLDRWLSRPEVNYVGRKDPSLLGALLSQCQVGLTPYADDAFNRASFPLKTLDYLANGLTVVSSDIPASRWFDSPYVRIARSPADFASQVAEYVAGELSEQERHRRAALATVNSWDRRAAELAGLIDKASADVGSGLRNHQSCPVPDQASKGCHQRHEGLLALLGDPLTAVKAGDGVSWTGSPCRVGVR